MSNTFEQKIRLAALEDKGEDVAVVKVSDLVALLNSKESSERACAYWVEAYGEEKRRHHSTISQALQEKACKCSKYIDLRT